MASFKSILSDLAPYIAIAIGYVAGPFAGFVASAPIELFERDRVPGRKLPILVERRGNVRSCNDTPPH